jgi:hypothetical protein
VAHVVPAAQRLHLSATDCRRGRCQMLRAVSIVIHIVQFLEQILQPSSDENIFLKRSSSGSTRNAAATRPQPTMTRVPASASLKWFIDGLIQHPCIRLSRQGSERWAQSAWVIPSDSVGNLNIKHWPSPRSNIINALCTTRAQLWR